MPEEAGAHKTFLKINYISGHKGKLRKSQEVELIQAIFSVHNETKLKINNKKALLSDNWKNLSVKNFRVKR